MYYPAPAMARCWKQGLGGKSGSQIEITGSLSQSMVERLPYHEGGTPLPY